MSCFVDVLVMLPLAGRPSLRPHDPAQGLDVDVERARVGAGPRIGLVESRHAHGE